MSDAPILITGASGKTGRRVVRRLRARGLAVREASRSATIPFDWNTPATWRDALDGVKRVYVAYAPDLAAIGAAERIEAFAEEAVRAGMQHLVLLSGRNEVQAQRCESIIQSCGAASTVLRASWFSQNFSEGALHAAVCDGLIAVPAGVVQEPFTDADDIADVAVAALTDARHAGRLYELTGPRLLTFADAADELSRACGRPVRYVSPPLDDFLEMTTAAVGADLARLLTDLFAEVLDGRNASLAHGVEEALGRAPRDFADFCSAAAQAGAWDLTAGARR